MKQMTHAIYGLMLLFILCSNQAWSQSDDQSQKKSNYKKNPHWIQMMDDPNVNYHEAVKAFDEFWKDRGEPEKEREEGECEKKRSLLKRIIKSDEKEQEENMQYAVAYKRFKQWKRDVEPFVQSDGSILSKEEQMQIWENSRK